MITDKDMEEIISLLSGNYSCGRTWSAWQYGTMQEDDFAPLDEDDSFIDDLLSVVDRIRRESADKARKEAAERAVRFFDDFRICVPPNKYNMPQETLEQLRAAIIGDSVIKENLTTDHKYDCAAYATEGKTDAEKLAIAVKALKWALEYIGNGFLPEEGTPDHECGYTTAPDTGYCEFCENYWIARESLKEIQ